MWTEHRFISFDETPLFYRSLLPQEALKAVALVVHGMGEHGGRYRHLAEYLAGLGIGCWIPDLRGTGLSGGKRATVRHFSDFHEDPFALHSLAARTHRGAPLFLLGHSFGGLVSASYLAFHEHPKVNGLVLSSPLFGIAFKVPLWRHWLGRLVSLILPDFMQPSLIRSETLTHDQAILHQYAQDPLVSHEISARLYAELTERMAKKRQIASRIACPVLIVQSGQDKIVSSRDTVRFYDSLKSDDKEMETYEDFYHEVLNEVGRQAVFSRIGMWELKHIDSKVLN